MLLLGSSSPCALLTNHYQIMDINAWVPILSVQICFDAVGLLFLFMGSLVFCFSNILNAQQPSWKFQKTITYFCYSLIYPRVLFSFKFCRNVWHKTDDDTVHERFPLKGCIARNNLTSYSMRIRVLSWETDAALWTIPYLTSGHP